jgi:hypothetical protein
MNSSHLWWCARDHRCAGVLGEHRAQDIVINVPGTGRAVLTRVRSADGAEHAEIRVRVKLPAHEAYARGRLGALLDGLRRTLIGARGGDR